MSIQRYVMISCNAIVDRVGNECGEEEGPALTETAVRKMARGNGWLVGHNRAAWDRCPKHRDADCRPLSWRAAQPTEADDG